MASFPGSIPTVPMAVSAPTVGEPVALELPALKQSRNPLTRKQLEKVVSRFVAIGGLVFGAQAIPSLLAQATYLQLPWLWLVAPALFGWLVVTLVLSFAQVWVRGAHGTFVLLYFLAVATLPIAIIPGAPVDPGLNWLNWLLTVATGMAAIAFSTTLATAVLFGAPICFMVVRLMPAGGSAPPVLAILECILAIILGAAVLIIITMLRQAASGVDIAQSAAIDRYSNAVHQHATEVERVQVDAIVHDSVLTTLLTAARAEGAEAKALAAGMARSAIDHLRDAALVTPDDDRTVSSVQVAERIAESASAMTWPIEMRVAELEHLDIPVQAAETIHSAAVQAMVNSVQHAGDRSVKRWVSIETTSERVLVVAVADAGVGYLMSDIPSARLGVRVSIVERVGHAGGHARVQSAPGLGTTVTIRWPRYPNTARSPELDGESVQ
jgi:signal transduction histidine kinase